MKTLSKWGPVIAWMALIFLLSSLPKEAIPVSGGETVSAIAHLLEYGVLALLLSKALEASSGVWSRSMPRFAASIAITLLYGLSDEWHQSFVPGRSSSLSDLGVDAAGAVLALSLASWKGRLSRRPGSIKLPSLRTTFGFLVTFAFLALALRKIDWGQTAEAFRQADYRLAAVAVLSTALSYVLRTIRWGWILRPAEEFPFSRLYPPLVIGFAVNNILPGRLGEFARAYLLSRKEGVSGSLAFATVVMERVLDGLTIVGALALVGLFWPLPTWGRQLAWVSGAFFASALIFLAGLFVARAKVTAMASLLIRPLPERWRSKLLGMLDAFAEGLDILRSPGTLAVVTGLSVVVWGVEAVTYCAAILAFHIPLEGIGLLWQTLFLLSVVNLGIMIPAAPGGVGPYQAAAILALGAFGFPREVALSVSLVTHFVQYALVTGTGLLCLWREEISLGKLVRSRR